MRVRGRGPLLMAHRSRFGNSLGACKINHVQLGMKCLRSRWIIVPDDVLHSNDDHDLHRRMKVEKRRKLAKAERHDRRRVMIHQKLIMSRMRAVLKFEAMWIKEVRYQFAYSLREEVFKALQLNVRAEKAERLVKMNRYREVL